MKQRRRSERMRLIKENRSGLDILSIEDNSYAHLPLLQMPEQHSAPVEHAAFVCLQVPACTAVGAVIEATIGTAMAAPMPTRLNAARREIDVTRG